MGKKQTKIIPQFTVTIVIDGVAIVTIDVCEDATLEDARKEILLESEEFSNLPTDYYFNYKNAPFSIRKENSRTVREVAGSDSRLILIPKIDKTTKSEEANNNNSVITDQTKEETKNLILQQEQEENKIETTLKHTETAIDTIDEINNTIVDFTYILILHI